MANRMKGTEKRTERVNVVLTPTSAEGVRAMAKATGRTLNDLLNEIIENALAARDYTSDAAKIQAITNAAFDAFKDTLPKAKSME